MVTTKTDKPAGRVLKDKEVLTVRHDELLSWSIDHLETLVADNWGLSQDEMPEAIAEARESAATWLDRFQHELAKFESGERTVTVRDGGINDDDEETQVSNETIASIKSAMKRKVPLHQAIFAHSTADETGDALLKSFTVMKPVCKVDTRKYNDYKRTPAGFIDLVAEIFSPAKLQIRIENAPREKSDDDYNFFSRYYTQDEEVRKGADALVKDGLQCIPLGTKKSIWFSVRSDSFTLGQILQELKSLKQLEDETQEIALVVTDITDRMRQNIEREGFIVIAREDYPALV